MDEFSIVVEVTVEASGREDAEELLVELLESDPAMIEWNIHRANAETVVA